MPNVHEARELSLYTTNNGPLRFGRIESIIQNLARKQVKGTYDATLALKLWRSIADDMAKAYAKEFCGPDFDPRQFSKATRDMAAQEIADYYAEAIAEHAEDMAKDAANRKRWTLSAIKAANEDAGRFYFSRDTMKFFGDTMASFAVRYEGGAIYVERVRPMRDRDGRNMGGLGDRKRFNPETGDIS